MKKNLFLIVLFIAIIFFGRVFPHPYNFTPLIAVTLLSSYALSNRLLVITIPIFGVYVKLPIISYKPYFFGINNVIVFIDKDLNDFMVN